MKDTIKPILGQSFGEILSVDVEFIEKGNTYFEQNVVESPFLAKIAAVNGVNLKEPIIIEYVVDKHLFEEAPCFKTGVKYSLKCYEDIYSMGNPIDWSTTPNQFNYEIHHRIFLRSAD